MAVCYDVAGAVGKVALGSPLKGTVEVGGPERFHLDELARMDLAARKDPRKAITDPQAYYYGIQVTERTLVPEDKAQRSEVRVKTGAVRVSGRPRSRFMQPERK